MRRHRLLNGKVLFFGHSLEVNFLEYSVRGGLGRPLSLVNEHCWVVLYIRIVIYGVKRRINWCICVTNRVYMLILISGTPVSRVAVLVNVTTTGERRDGLHYATAAWRLSLLHYSCNTALLDHQLRLFTLIHSCDASATSASILLLRFITDLFCVIGVCKIIKFSHVDCLAQSYYRCSSSIVLFVVQTDVFVITKILRFCDNKIVCERACDWYALI